MYVCGTEIYLYVIFMNVCCVIDTLANICTLNMIICMCLYRGGEGPIKIFAPSPIPAMVICVMLSCDKVNKLISNKQTNKHLEDKNVSGSVRSEFNDNDLLWRTPELFVLPHDEVRGGLSSSPTGCFFVCVFDCLS